MGDPYFFYQVWSTYHMPYYEYMQLLYGCNTSFELALLRGEQSQTFK